MTIAVIIILVAMLAADVVTIRQQHGISRKLDRDQDEPPAIA